MRCVNLTFASTKKAGMESTQIRAALSVLFTFRRLIRVFVPQLPELLIPNKVRYFGNGIGPTTEVNQSFGLAWGQRIRESRRSPHHHRWPIAIDLPPVFVPLAMLVLQGLGLCQQPGLPVAPAACSPANCSGAYFFLGISPPFLRPRLLTLHLDQFSGAGHVGFTTAAALVHELIEARDCRQPAQMGQFGTREIRCVEELG